MSLKIVLELDESDLKHFSLIMQQACAAAADAQPEDIVAAAEALLTGVSDRHIPQFIESRLGNLRDLIDMIQDEEWRLPEENRRRVLHALAYFTEPEDLIPDNIPGIGYLDDAIMIELAVRELGPEIEAYRDFCEFRQQEATRRGVKAKTTDITREDWLANRREQLQKRLLGRPRKSGSDGKSRDGLFKLF
jgi:uncharacterized membrane protein YkvA (DUF1232 family)